MYIKAVRESGWGSVFFSTLKWSCFHTLNQELIFLTQVQTRAELWLNLVFAAVTNL